MYQSLAQFIETRSQQEIPSGRLLADCSFEAQTLLFSYVDILQKEFMSSLSYDEQLMLACFILLAEGQELPV